MIIKDMIIQSSDTGIEALKHIQTRTAMRSALKIITANVKVENIKLQLRSAHLSLTLGIYYIIFY